MWRLLVTGFFSVGGPCGMRTGDGSVDCELGPRDTQGEPGAAELRAGWPPPLASCLGWQAAVGQCCGGLTAAPRLRARQAHAHM